MNDNCETTNQEDLIKEKTDKNNRIWTKKYVGGGAHFLNWLAQFREVYGEENVETEEINPEGFICFEKGREKMFRIWVREPK